jgi:hypothetical protein
MAESRRMNGWLRVRAASTPDGDRQVLTVLPNGARFLVPPAEAMAYAFALLALARDLIPQGELDRAVTSAYDRSHELVSEGRTQ